MKKTVRILVPLVLTIVILLCTFWYLFIYDREFTRDMLLHAARSFDNKGNHTVAAWFYDCAYKQAGDNDAVAIELAEQYKETGNYTKAEHTLTKAISDGGGVELYIALSKTFVEQDKLLDAVKMLDNVKNTDVKAQLDMLRPAAPTCSPDPQDSNYYFTQYITVSVSAEKGTLYVSSNGEYPSIEKDLYKDGIQLKDGKTTIHAIAVAENGLVSPSAFFPFTVGGVIEDVTFADAAIEAAMRELLQVSADRVLRTDDLWTIKEFTVPANATNWSDLSHLAFAEKLTVDAGAAGQITHISALANLKELHISNTTVGAEELVFIGKLPNLQRLTLANCGLSTVSGLDTAKELLSLDLNNNAIRNITPLGALKKITQINLSHNALDDLTVLSTLSTLTELDVSFNGLTTLSPITSLTGLEVLIANDNAVTDLVGFQQLTALKKLVFSNNKIADISTLSACGELTDLVFTNNSVSDISVLGSMNKLVNLNFSKNSVSVLPKWDADCALVNIDGSYNKLSTLEQLSGLKHLNNVFMDHNAAISSVKALANCPALIQVNVFGTKVRNVSDLTSLSVIVNYNPT
ncbi:MAG: leucine-rich repeat domain-containing protein [Oscillospiraceae bacterium]|nr:leucine-rich repeat domain-containing protein [Oscillospiraceae bacterium]